MTIDASLIEIGAPDASHHADLRSAVDAIDDALSNGWDAGEGGGVTTRSGERIFILPPFSQWIGGCDAPPLGADLLRLVRDLSVRILADDLGHPHAEEFACSPRELAEAMMLVSAQRLPPHANRAAVIAELPNPFGAPRIHWRQPAGASPRSHRISDPVDTARWASLAPPCVGLFVTRNSIDGGRMVDLVTIGLVMRQSSSRAERLRNRHMDVLRATALLASAGDAR